MTQRAVSGVPVPPPRQGPTQPADPEWYRERVFLSALAISFGLHLIVVALLPDVQPVRPAPRQVMKIKLVEVPKKPPEVIPPAQPEPPPKPVVAAKPAPRKAHAKARPLSAPKAPPKLTARVEAVPAAMPSLPTPAVQRSAPDVRPFAAATERPVPVSALPRVEPRVDLPKLAEVPAPVRSEARSAAPPAVRPDSAAVPRATVIADAPRLDARPDVAMPTQAPVLDRNAPSRHDPRPEARVPAVGDARPSAPSTLPSAPVHAEVREVPAYPSVTRSAPLPGRGPEPRPEVRAEVRADARPSVVPAAAPSLHRPDTRTETHDAPAVARAAPTRAVPLEPASNVRTPPPATVKPSLPADTPTVAVPLPETRAAPVIARGAEREVARHEPKPEAPPPVAPPLPVPSAVATPRATAPPAAAPIPVERPALAAAAPSVPPREPPTLPKLDRPVPLPAATEAPRANALPVPPPSGPQLSQRGKERQPKAGAPRVTTTSVPRAVMFSGARGREFDENAAKGYAKGFSAQIRDHFVGNYPPLALRSRQEGALEVEVRFNEGGKCVEVTLRQPTGHRSLDEATIEAARGICRHYPPPPGVASVILPIEFHIDEIRR